MEQPLLDTRLLPDAGDELSVLVSSEHVGQDRSQPLHFLFGSVLLQHAEELFFHFGIVAKNLLDLREAG